MSTKNKVLFCLMWLVLPYVVVIAACFGIGFLIGLSNSNGLSQSGLDTVVWVAGLLIAVCWVLAVLVWFNKPRALYGRLIK